MNRQYPYYSHNQNQLHHSHNPYYQNYQNSMHISGHKRSREEMNDNMSHQNVDNRCHQNIGYNISPYPSTQTIQQNQYHQQQQQQYINNNYNYQQLQQSQIYQNNSIYPQQLSIQQQSIHNITNQQNTTNTVYEQHKKIHPISKRFGKFNIMSIQNKGFGWIATTKIECGQIIFTEKPLIIKKSHTTKANINEMIKKLNDTLLMEYMQLTSAEDIDAIYGIYKNNCLPIHHPKDATAIYLNVSRINHDCSPNAHFYTKGDDKQIEIVALKDINYNQEITISCIDILKYHHYKRRENYLLKKYNFKCLCNLCRKGNKLDTTLDDISDKIRWCQRIMYDLQHHPERVSQDPMWGWNKIAEDSMDIITKIDDKLDGHPLLKSDILPFKYMADIKLLQHKMKQDIKIKPFMVNQELKQQMEYFGFYPK